jgi:glycine/D-amino acid oxidase-like deaminating enzyme
VQDTPQSTASADVVVVGTGIVGLCIAHKLLQKGVSVILTDRQQACAGATGAGACSWPLTVTGYLDYELFQYCF